MISLPIVAALTVHAASCHAVLDEDQIFGRHLAAADARLAALPSSLFVGLAPVPGMRRVILPAQLRRLASDPAVLAATLEPVCLEWPMRTPTPELFAEAIQSSLGSPDLPVEVLDFSKASIPPGKIVFERAALSCEAMLAGPGCTWRGHVMNQGKRTFSVWARVRIRHISERLVASQDLRAGEVLRADQLGAALVEGLPATQPLTKEQLVGQTVRHQVRAGRPVALSDLLPPLAVVKGESVAISVQRGAVRFQVSALADSSGRIGEWVKVRNSDSGMIFKALVEGPGKARVP
jgi:flagella basal body P-ring formation protein FlgA